ncbi:MAG: serine/threonine protein kinase [Gemmatimonadota bacterium]|nr:serine/threonine protein kinase [Gemmatimonadota bacterium]
MDILARLTTALQGRYEIEGELGRGGMATVYRARDLRHDRHVAIKAFATDTAGDAASQRFQLEIRIVAALSHPHIVPLFDSATEAGVAWFAMPVVEGESLRQRLAREGQLPLDDARRITLEVASALAYAHGQGVVHRDIKPENILLQHAQAVVSDFGVARALAGPGGSRLTGTGLGVGTPAYMSPEQISGESDVGPHADQYALAMVFYEMLTGDQPFSASTPQALLARKMHGEIHAVSTVRPSVTPAVDALLRKALAPVAADRFPDMHAFAEAVRASEDPDAERRVRRVARNRRAVAAGIGVIGVVAAVLLWLRLAGVPLDPHLIAIYPFRVSTPGANDWSETLPDLLATTLEGTPGLRVADPWSLWRLLRASDGGALRSPDPREASELARTRGAARYLLGSVRRDGARMGVTVRLYFTATDSVELTFVEEAAEDSLGALAERLAIAIMGASGGQGPGAEGLSPGRSVTSSPKAMKEYLAARAALRRGMIDSANRAIDRAVALDSSFALALTEAVGIKSWAQSALGQPYAGLRRLIAKARASESSLGERNRFRLQLQDALIETDGPRAAELARRLVEIDPSDFEAWNATSYMRQVLGWQFGATPADALEAADRALALDSTNALALTRRLFFASQGGDPGDMRRQLVRVAQYELDGVARGMELALEILLARDAGVDSLLDVVSTYPIPVWTSAYRAVRTTRPDRAGALARHLLQRAEPGFETRMGQNMVALLELAAGRADSVAAMYDAAAGSFAAPDRHRFDLGFLAAAILGLSTDAMTDRAIESLRREAPVDSAVALFQRRDIWRSGWMLAAYHAGYGDTTVTRRWRTVMDSFPTEGAHPAEYVKALQSDLDARLAARRGDTRTALAHASRALGLWTIHTDNASEIDPEVQIRFLTAGLLRAEGLADSAAIVLASLTPPATWLVGITPLAWMELGELAEAGRDCAHAAAHYASALRLWDTTSLAVAGPRARARAGQARCGAQGR